MTQAAIDTVFPMTVDNLKLYEEIVAYHWKFIRIYDIACAHEEGLLSNYAQRLMVHGRVYEKERDKLLEDAPRHMVEAFTARYPDRYKV